MFVKVARSLQSTWHLTDDELRVFMFEKGKRRILEGVASCSTFPIKVDLNTYTAPPQCPYDLSRIRIKLGEPSVGVLWSLAMSALFRDTHPKMEALQIQL